MVVDKFKFYTGLGMLLAFIVFLAILFSPIFGGGKNGLEYLDELYNSLSKYSSYFIEDLREDVSNYTGTTVDIVLDMGTDERVEQTALLYEEAGSKVVISGTELYIDGDLGLILDSCLVDSEDMYYNDAETIENRYGYDARQVLYNWWGSLQEMEEQLEDDGAFDDAEIVARVMERGVEPAYNFYGIEPQSVSSRLGIVIFSLLFYVVYTVWYGFALMYLVEGMGLKIKQMLPFRFLARVKLT